MAGMVPQQITLTGFFTSQGWLRGRSLDELERLLGYRTGRLSIAGAAVYAFTRVPENWEFELQGYTNVSGGLQTDPAWVRSDRAAAKYHAATGTLDSETIRKNMVRANMTVNGSDRRVKVKPLLVDPNDPYPPGAGIPQWRVSDKATQLSTLRGNLLIVLQPGASYPK